MPTFIPNSATILSIFPVALESRFLHTGYMTYKHPAVPKDSILVRTYNPERVSSTNRVPEGTPDSTDETRPCEVNQGYCLIRVFDTFCWTRDFTQDSEHYLPHPVAAGNVARDLASLWSSDALAGDGGSKPGIRTIAGEEPTAVELAELREMQTRYFRTLVNDGHSLFSKGQVKDISDLHRQAAKWLGANNLPWLPKIEQVAIKKCVACANEIRSEALRCEKCNVDLPDFYKKYGIEVDPLLDPAVFALLARMPASRVK